MPTDEQLPKDIIPAALPVHSLIESTGNAAGEQVSLHILNGDHALNLWKKCGFSGQNLVWKETYLEGPLPVTDDLHIFRTARSKYLSTLTETAGIDEKKLCKHLQKMDEAVLNLPEKSNMMLWFDSCIFDQTILMRILYLLELKNCENFNVFLYCCSSNCLTSDDFQTGMDKKLRLLPQDWQLGSKAWKYFQSQDADNMLKLSEHGCFERLIPMQKALRRCAAEVPDKDGLTQTQRNILTLVSSGKHSFLAIFKGLSDLEEYPFAGDTACQRNLDKLTANHWLTVRNNAYFPAQVPIKTDS